MSETAAERQLNPPSRAIPTRRILLNEASQLPMDYSTTPGGTLFSTTPGGTRIIYERQFLLNCRNSPLTKSPPPNLPKIPGVTSPIAEEDVPKENGHRKEDDKSVNVIEEHPDEPQFAMDI